VLVDREYFLDYMTYKRPLKPIFIEIFGLLVGLDQEWAAQGATPEEISLEAFDLDRIKTFRIPTNTRILNGFKEEVLEETDEYIIRRDKMGRTLKLCKDYATIPLPMDFPVRNMEDWERIKPEFLYSPERLAQDWLAKTKAAKQEGAVIFFSMPGGFDIIRDLMGCENACLAFYEQPELVEDILKTVGDTVAKLAEEVLAQVSIDVLDMHEDFAGRSGPLIGPNLFNKYLKPYYRRIWDMVSAQGTPLFRVDSDGNLNPILDALMDAGVNFIYPCEARAEMDVVALRKKYGCELRLLGGIDKMALRGNKEDIDRELQSKLPYMINSGGYIIGLDHRIPNGVPVENYRYYVRRVREMIEEHFRA